MNTPYLHWEVEHDGHATFRISSTEDQGYLVHAMANELIEIMAAAHIRTETDAFAMRVNTNDHTVAVVWKGTLFPVESAKRVFKTYRGIEA